MGTRLDGVKIVSFREPGRVGFPDCSVMLSHVEGEPIEAWLWIGSVHFEIDKDLAVKIITDWRRKIAEIPRVLGYRNERTA